jgi:mannose-6-phosphate isomerase-like protein (cupin superfamily)
MILEGRGIMEVDGEKASVACGDTIFIPSNSLHGLSNESKTTTLTYISAGSPVFGKEAERELWPLQVNTQHHDE